MARQPQVTRTITTTVVTLKCVNVEEESIFEQNITLPRTYKDTEKLMKQVEKVFAGSPVKPLSIVSTEVQETLYGMTEQEFIMNAKVLPKRMSKLED